MVMDKGLSVRQAEDMIETAGEFIDFVHGLGAGIILKRYESQFISLDTLNEVDNNKEHEVFIGRAQEGIRRLSTILNSMSEATRL